MLESRWLRWVGPGVIALVAVGSIAATAIGAGQRPWIPRACADDGGGRAAATRSAGPIDLADLRLEPWFRLDPRLDRAGTLQGQRLALGTDGGGSSRIMDMAPEAFAAGPFGQVVLVGTDDGVTSRLELVDVAGECSWVAAQEAEVIRRATIDPSGSTIYEMRVDRATRADLGVWTRSIDGSTPPARILEPIGLDDRFGVTYTTELTWDLSGSRLVVQSCGEAACRTRIYEPSSGRVRAISEPDLGVLVGLDGDELVSYAACPGFPCPIVGMDVVTGVRSLLAEAGAAAVVIGTPDGPRLVHEQIDETGIALRSVALDGSAVSNVGLVPDGLRLHASDHAVEAATRLPPGWVLLSSDGRLPSTGPDAQTQLRHVPDGAAVQLEEVVR